MNSNSTILIKVKYGDTLRRFNAVVNEDKQLSLDMDGLMKKITSLFNISAESELGLTYIDEDGDVVTLVDDDDLKNVVTQKLKFMRIDVHCNDKKFVNYCTRSSALSPMSTTKVLNPLPSIKHGAPGMLEDMPQHFHEASSDISPTMSSKAAHPTLVNPKPTELLNSTSTPGHSISGDTTRNVIGKGKGPVIDVSSPIDLNFEPSSDSNRVENTAADCKFVRDPTFGCTPNSIGSPVPFYPGSLVSPIISTNHLDAKIGNVRNYTPCDWCGVKLLLGVNFQSEKKTKDIILCGNCYCAVGKKGDYLGIEMPGSTLDPQIKPPMLGGLLRHNSRFVLDVSISDGTVMAPCTSFKKIWKMQNSGTLMWHQGFKLVWIGGDLLTNAISVELEIPSDGVPVDGMLDVKAACTAPELPGRYVSYWKMQSPTAGVFGQRIWVIIQVDSNMKDSVSDNRQGLNLNLLPKSNVPEGPDSIDINVQPWVDTHSMDTTPVDEQSEKKEPNIPIDDTSPPVPLETPLSSPVSSDTSDESSEVSSDNSDESSEVSSDISDESSEVSSSDGSGTTLSNSCSIDSTPSHEEDIASETVELSLLQELEEMGFKETNLNKEILRKNEYDLEQSVDALCGVSDWDPMLDELEEMVNSQPSYFTNPETQPLSQPSYFNNPETQPLSQPSYFSNPETQPLSQPSYNNPIPATLPYNYYNNMQGTQPYYSNGAAQPYYSNGEAQTFSGYNTNPQTQPYNYYQTTPATPPYSGYTTPALPPFFNSQTMPPRTQPYYHYNMPGTQPYYY